MEKLNKKTKERLLDTALDLFYHKGYDNTAVGAIVDTAGVSKGAFYHYFGSKEDLMEEIINTHVESFYTNLNNIATDKSKTALQKVELFIMDSQRYKSENFERLSKINILVDQGQNWHLREKVFEKTLANACPVFEKIIRQGISEGVFDTDFPKEVSEFVIYMVGYFKTVILECFLRLGQDLKVMTDLKRKILFYENVLNRILGVKDNALTIPIDEDYIKDLYNKYKKVINSQN